jgi:hypothetical protein
MEWGKRISLMSRSRLPTPSPIDAVAHSPTPSAMTMAARSKGLAKNADAAWDSWCRLKKSSPWNPGRCPAITLGILSF